MPNRYTRSERKVREEKKANQPTSEAGPGAVWGVLLLATLREGTNMRNCNADIWVFRENP